MAGKVAVYCSDKLLNDVDFESVGVGSDTYVVRMPGLPATVGHEWVEHLEVLFKGPTEIFLFVHTECAWLGLGEKEVNEREVLIHRLWRTIAYLEDAYRGYGHTIRAFFIETATGKIEELAT